MWPDEILDEIHKFREEHAKAFNYDLDAMFADWQKRQAESSRQVVSLPPKQALKHRGIILKQDKQPEPKI